MASVSNFFYKHQSDPVSIIFLVQTTSISHSKSQQEGLAVASIARDGPSALPGDDPFHRTRMHRNRNER